MAIAIPGLSSVDHTFEKKSTSNLATMKWKPWTSPYWSYTHPWTTHYSSQWGKAPLRAGPAGSTQEVRREGLILHQWQPFNEERWSGCWGNNQQCLLHQGPSQCKQTPPSCSSIPCARLPKIHAPLRNTAFPQVEIVLCSQTHMTLFELTMQKPAGEMSGKAH